MTTVRTTVAVVALGLGLARVTSAAEPQAKSAEKKPLVTCKQIVETYKVNQSVDETADSLFVDQSVVAACLEAAGITPNKYDR